jgi:hypothetical protein
MIGLVNTDELPSCPSRRGIAAHAPAHGAEHVTQECAAPLLPIDLVALPLLVLRGLAMRLSMPGGALLPSNDTPLVRDAFVTLRICSGGCRAGDTAAVARDGRGRGSDRKRCCGDSGHLRQPQSDEPGWLPD